MSETRKQILSRFIEAAWNQGDLDAAEAYLAPTYRIRHDPGDPWDGKTLSRAEFRERLAASRAPCPDQRFETEALIAEGDKVVMIWRWSGTHTGVMAGYAPTGRTLTMSGATVYDFDDEDRIAGHWQIKDALSVYQQLARGAG